MVFPEPVGVLTNHGTIDAVGSSQKWAEVRLEGVRIVQLVADVAILIHKASARREGDGSPYAALVSSVCVSRDGVWKLAFHQHTPGGER